MPITILGARDVANKMDEMQVTSCGVGMGTAYTNRRSNAIYPVVINIMENNRSGSGRKAEGKSYYFIKDGQRMLL